MMRSHKRGDIREDGMIFWAYKKSCKNGENWITHDEFLHKRNVQKKCNNKWYLSDKEENLKKAK